MTRHVKRANVQPDWKQQPLCCELLVGARYRITVQRAQQHHSRLEAAADRESFSLMIFLMEVAFTVETKTEEGGRHLVKERLVLV